MTATKTLKEKKMEVIDRILRQDTYQKDSGLRMNVTEQLMRLPLKTLHNLDLLMVFRVQESNELTRQVDRILAK